MLDGGVASRSGARRTSDGRRSELLERHCSDPSGKLSVLSRAEDGRSRLPIRDLRGRGGGWGAAARPPSRGRASLRGAGICRAGRAEGGVTGGAGDLVSAVFVGTQLEGVQVRRLALRAAGVALRRRRGARLGPCGSCPSGGSRGSWASGSGRAARRSFGLVPRARIPGDSSARRRGWRGCGA